MTKSAPPGVLVTGLGAVSALGVGADALWDGLLSGASALRPAPISPRGIPVPRAAGTVGGAARIIEEHVDPKYLRRLSSLSRYAVGAATLCLRHSRHPERWSSAEETGLRDATSVILGTSYGSSAYHFEYYEKLFRNGIKDASPLLFSESVMNSASGHIAIYLKLRGASLALVGGEEVGLSAVADGADRIRLGEARAALAGGAEEYCDFVHAALAARGLVCGEVGEAYAGGERGGFLGEGAAFLLLESGDLAPGGEEGALAFLTGAAVARGDVQGKGGSGAAGGAESVERAISGALLEAQIDPARVDLVVTSGCGSALDRQELEGIVLALRPGSRRGGAIVLTAPKTALGEGFAFTSAVEALVAVKALSSDVVPPTLGTGEAPRLPAGLRLAREPIEGKYECALAVSLNSRGNAAAVVFQGQKRQCPGPSARGTEASFRRGPGSWRPETKRQGRFLCSFDVQWGQWVGSSGDPAVHGNHLSRDVACFGGREEADDRRHLLRLAEAAEARGFFQPLPVLFREAVHRRGVDGSGRDRVHQDAKAAHLSGQRPRKPVHAGLGGGVMGLSGKAQEPAGRGNVDDPAVVRGNHGLDGKLRELEESI